MHNIEKQQGRYHDGGLYDSNDILRNGADAIVDGCVRVLLSDKVVFASAQNYEEVYESVARSGAGDKEAIGVNVFERCSEFGLGKRIVRMSLTSGANIYVKATYYHDVAFANVAKAVATVIGPTSIAGVHDYAIPEADQWYPAMTLILGQNGTTGAYTARVQYLHLAPGLRVI